MGLFNKIRSKLNRNIILRLGEDFRSAGSWTIAGVSGAVLFSNDMSMRESLFFVVCGFVLWIMGHIFIYISENIHKKSKKVAKNKR